MQLIVVSIVLFLLELIMAASFSQPYQLHYPSQGLLEQEEDGEPTDIPDDKGSLIVAEKSLDSFEQSSPSSAPIPAGQEIEYMGSKAVQQAAQGYAIVALPGSYFIKGAPYGSPSSHGIDGRYTLSPEPVNGYLVYQKVSRYGHPWYFYQRKNNKWYVDFNKPSEDWSGTVTYSLSAGLDPELLEFNGATVVFKFDAILTANLPYQNGVFTFDDQVYNKAPVYKHSSGYYMYRRSGGYAAGGWVSDFNGIDDTWSGTVAYSKNSKVPYGIAWNK